MQLGRAHWSWMAVALLCAAGCGSSSGGRAGTSGGGGAPGSAGSFGAGGSGGATPSGGAGGSGGSGAKVGVGGAGATGGTSAGGATGGTGAGGATGGSSGAGGSSCTDVCPAPNGGVAWNCEKRFMYGVNYAWNVFAGDFGGIPSWGQSGVAGNAPAISAALADMHAHGASVIRWWMFPDFRGAGITFDGSGTPTGLGGSAPADIQLALQLAAQNDVYVMFTLFSFDDFKPTAEVNGIHVPSITPMVTNATKRAALMAVVRQVAHTVASSQYADRMIAWDVINEPEWAISGSDPYGDQAFAPTASLDTVTFSQMEAFIKQTVGVLRSQSSALVTVGGAAAKWAKAWTQVGVDFYSLHIYDWVDTWWPYDNPPSTYGLDKPIVMQEMAFGGLNGTPYATVVKSFWDNGYAGVLPWAWNGATAAQKTAFKAFADQHSCETNYSQTSPYVISSPKLEERAPTSLPNAVPSLRRCRETDGVPNCSVMP